MPGWLLTLILQVVVKFGLPALITAVMNYSKTPAEVKIILQKLLDALENPTVSNSAARKTAVAELKECVGVACQVDPKK